MKALPLWQPWATLVALGAKRIETRHWQPPERLIGERIAIHATKTTDHLWICETAPFSSYIRAPLTLPLGAVIATATLAGVNKITEMFTPASIGQHEYAFGDYTPGRFAWALSDVRPLSSPLLWRGSQGIFDVPDHLIEEREVTA